MRHVVPHVDKESIDKFFRIFGSDVVESSCVVSLPGKNFTEDYDTWVEAYSRIREESKGCVMSIDYSFLELKYQGDIQSILRSIVDMSRIMRASHDLLVIVSRPNFKTLEVMKSVSDVHLKIFEHNGATMLAAIKPQLFLSNIQTDSNLGFPRAMLLDSR